MLEMKTKKMEADLSLTNKNNADLQNRLAEQQKQTQSEKLTLAGDLQQQIDVIKGQYDSRVKRFDQEIAGY